MKFRQRTDEAVAREVFGVPTFFVEDELFLWTRSDRDGGGGCEWLGARPRADGCVSLQPNKQRGTMSSRCDSLEYFYDLSSPYAYMAVDEVQLVTALQRRGRLEALLAGACLRTWA